MEKLRNFCRFKKTYSEEQEELINKEFTRLEDLEHVKKTGKPNRSNAQECSGKSDYNALEYNDQIFKKNDKTINTDCQHYLEHAGATLYSEKQLQNVLFDLSRNIYGNPHAENNFSKLTEDTIDQVRFQILKHFATDSNEYSVIFTSGTTASLKLIAESFVYENEEEEKSGTFAYLLDNHTSVLGMRAYAPNVKYFSQTDIIKALNAKRQQTKANNNNSLFVYPAQSNFSGTKYPLWWIKDIQNGALNGAKDLKSKNWFVLLDAPCLAYNDVLSLSKYKPDFVTVSFYKMFGYPTGVGALLVKNSSAWVLQKTYLGGGTVLMVLSTENIMVPRKPRHERFEDGTLSYLSIAAVKYGFSTLERLKLNFELVACHTFELAKYVYRNLITFHHFNGKPVAVIYNDTQFGDVQLQGGIVNFNLLRSDGEYIGYSEVLHVSNLYNIHIRTGCFCNPGACQMHLKLTAEDVRHHYNQGHVCGDQKDLIDGYPTGSVRISFGYMSTKENADAFLKMVEEYFVAKPLVRSIPQQWHTENTIFSHSPLESTVEMCSDVYTKSIGGLTAKSQKIGVLERIFLYPVKSCGAFSVSSQWEVNSTGLKYDRLWMIVNSSGVCVTQKHNRCLCLIRPKIDLKNSVLTLSYEGSPDIQVSLRERNEKIIEDASLCHSKVCGDRIIGWDCGDGVADWLCDVLGMDGLRLLRQCSQETPRTSKTGQPLPLSLTNKAQYLLINKASVQWLHESIHEDEFHGGMDSLVLRFRPNFLVNFHEPLIENDLTEVTIGDNTTFKCEGNCTRCQMICIDQLTAEKSAEPLKTLSRKMNGKIAFGVYLRQDFSRNGSHVNIGSFVVAK